jgi:antitoxin (DNA-binding transcriptional repressor) of toxin-antitoxin stability system
MKTLSQEVNLSGKFERISISELRNRPGDVLEQVNLGKTFLILKNGKPVAVLSKPPGETLAMEIGSTGLTQFVPAS